MTNKQYFNNHLLIDFDKLSTDDVDEINLVQNEFEINGWCFIRLPNRNGQLGNQLDVIQKTLSNFFNQQPMEKLRYESSNALGYTRVGHKEGIKLLTDQHGLRNNHHSFTNDVEETLQDLAMLLNNWINVLKSVIFKITQSSTEEMASFSPLNMLDIVHYYNNRRSLAEQPEVGLNTKEVNCVPHFDPGLFSLSILSTCDGLQLHDRSENKWINGPNNSEEDQRDIAVIWLGEAASILTQNRFQTGIHRVTYPRTSYQSRLTIWQEVCTTTQIDTLIQQDDKPIVMPENTEIQMKNQPNSLPFLVLSDGETLKTVMKRVEHERGISMSKTGGEHLQIRFPIVKKSSNSTKKETSFFSKLFNW